MKLLDFRSPFSLASRTEPATYLSLLLVKLYGKYKKMIFRERASFLFVWVDFVSEIAFGTHSNTRNRESINRHKNRSSVDFTSSKNHIEVEVALVNSMISLTKSTSVDFPE